jgi:predicted DNA-binding protein (MmcQ/YjbR family)
MHVEEIRAYCTSFPEATENLQWGDDLCFKIRGKIFATLALTAVPQKCCFKCTPETFAMLVEREDIHPAPYVGRYKWVILDRLDALAGNELRDLIRQSYEMVEAKAPAKARGKIATTAKGKADRKTKQKSAPAGAGKKGARGKIRAPAQPRNPGKSR